MLHLRELVATPARGRALLGLIESSQQDEALILRVSGTDPAFSCHKASMGGGGRAGVTVHPGEQTDIRG